MWRANQALKLHKCNKLTTTKNILKFYEYFYLYQLNKGACEHAL